MYVTYEVRTFFMHMPMQTQLHGSLTETFQESILNDLLITCCWMMPDGDTQCGGVFREGVSVFGLPDLLIGPSKKF